MTQQHKQQQHKHEQQTNTERFIWTAAALAQAAKGSWQNASSNILDTLTSQRICTDTRKIQSGDIFLALKGDNFDGHDYVAKAQALGATAAIVSTPSTELDVPQLVVDDTRLALGRLGAFVRAQNPKLSVVALTGSSGKTTTKELLGSILSQVAPTLITRGNLNNDLGVPMMLLEIESQHAFAVLELGANHVGEIAYTTDLVKPDVACVLNIGTAHLGEFGGREAICTAKSEIFSGLGQDGVAIIPSQGDFADQLHNHAAKHTKSITLVGSDVSAEDVQLGALGSTFDLKIQHQNTSQTAKVTLKLAGEHNITNALFAAAAAHALGADIDTIAQGLSAVTPPKGRLKPIDFGSHVLIDDTYNANPQAVIAAAKVLMAQGSTDTKRVLVLGDIGELGSEADTEHEKLGRALADFALDELVCVGTLMAHTAKGANASETKRVAAVRHFASKAEALTHLNQLLNTRGTVAMLFKGSRTATMETLIADILQT